MRLCPSVALSLVMLSPSPSTSHSLPICAQRRFLLLAAVGVLIYGVLYYFYSTPALAEPRMNREILVWPVTFLLVYLYWAGYRTVSQNTIPVSWIIGSGLLMAGIAVLVPPFHSTDVFGYINRGWQQVQYGMNPYVFTVDHIPGWERDPMITDHWVNNPSPYGFLYLQIAKALCWLGGGSKAITLLVFKLGNLVVHGLTALLVWLGVSRMAGKNAQKPLAGLSAIALYLYLWNPLVLVHGLINAHNDMLMGLFVTLAGFMGIVGSVLWILPALMAATLIKYGALVIIPFAVLFLLKNRAWSALVWGTVLAAAVFLLTGVSYLPDWQQFHLKEISRNAFVSHGSLHSLFYSIYKTIGKESIPVLYEQREVARAILKNILLGAYALFYGGLMFKRLRQAVYPAQQWIWDALLVMAVLVCLVSLKFYPWYLGMFFPLALFLAPGNWLRRFILVLSAAQLLSITFIGQAHLLNFILMTGLPIAWVLRSEQRRRQHNLQANEQPVASAS
jgi:alpha-1,6-mannosyltransferase